GLTITLGVLRRPFFPLSGLSSDVWVVEASTVGLVVGDGVTCNVDGRREIDPEIFEMVVYSEFAAELSDGTRAAWAGDSAASAGEGAPDLAEAHESKDEVQDPLMKMAEREGSQFEPSHLGHFYFWIYFPF
ncbi:hypothetical protein F5148DRAFT_1169128, partial [Russula earlei]